ncbi:nuclear transport factor 2 family protein [Halorientalis marina]|uniref:nuclear transport factor 2 family protein n=1 Tax=Halorientalis marina TaxID=2931976 RepID=UPI001FF380AD|nr:nuclear transport factor 2 family protein [Halorientalis marina]
MTDHVATVRDYYRALDEDDYDLLADILAPGFVHERSDMTLDGRERFVQFMREERPLKDTTHPLDAVYERDPDDATAGTAEVAAQGRLLKPDGSRLVSFVDVFTFDGDEIEKLRTYTH